MFGAVLFAVLLASSHPEVDAARILVVIPTPLRSHQLVFQPIWRELSLRGHQVTVITTTEPLRDSTLTNLTEINASFVGPVVEANFNVSEKLFSLRGDTVRSSRFFVQVMTAVNQEILRSRDVVTLIQSEKSRFDLVMVEYALPAFLALGRRFRCPLIALSAGDAPQVGHDAVGNPSHPALNPEHHAKYNLPLSFAQRLAGVYAAISDRVFSWKLHRYEDDVVEFYYSAGYRRLTELARTIDMFFMNVNPAFHNVRPTVPAVVHIGGGIHIKPPKPLPQDLQSFLDDGKQGIVYFSLGSIANTKNIPSRVLQVWTEAFAGLPYKVIWVGDGITGSDKVLVVKKWLPQQDVLRHPNVKLFVCPGGLMSIEEAIGFSLPLLLVPYGFDHFSNAVLVKSKGFGLILDFDNVEKNAIKEAVVELINNPQYKRNAEKMSKISADQPMTGLEKAVWWTEYVLRHKGAKHLRSPAIDMPFYQYFLLDVIGLLLVVSGIVVIGLCKLVRGVGRLLRKRAPVEKQKTVDKVKRN